jgi:hypothetical protein
MPIIKLNSCLEKIQLKTCREILIAPSRRHESCNLRLHSVAMPTKQTHTHHTTLISFHHTHKEAQTQINTNDDIFPLKKIHLTPNPSSQNGTSLNFFLCVSREARHGAVCYLLLWCWPQREKGRANERTNELLIIVVLRT